MCVNGVINMVSLAAIRIDKKVTYRVDGLATMSPGSSANHVSPIRHFLGVHIGAIIPVKEAPNSINSSLSLDVSN